jgi:site-specific DNA recombinase
MKAILIVRVSTDLQDYNAQIEDLKKDASERGYSDFHVISTKESGLADINNRDGLNELFTFIQVNKEYNTVFITELSRLGRRQSILQVVKEWFVDNKIQLIIKDSGYTLFKDEDRNEVSLEGTIMFTLFALFAENEIKTKKDRFARKRKELMLSGNSFFGGKILFGYELKKVSDKNKLHLHYENANTVREIFSWYINGIDEVNKNPSVLKIAKECIKRGYHTYTHSKRNINKLLKEEGYCGRKITNNKYKNKLYGKKNGEQEYIQTNNEIKYPKIIDVETFNKVQEKIKLKITDKKTKHITILSNLITCNDCGRKLSANYRSKTNSNSYRCTSRNETKECNEPIKSITMNLIDNIVWQLIKLDKKALISKIKEINPNIKLIEINNEINHLNNKIEKLNNDANHIKYIISNIKFNNINVTDIIDTNIKRLNKIEIQLNEFKEEINKLEFKKINAEKSFNKSDSIIYKNVNNIEGDLEKIKEYINHFIKEIIVKVNTKDYYVIQLEFKYFSRDYNKYIPTKDEVIDKYITLLVMKNTIDKIRLIKINKRFTTNILRNVLKVIETNPNIESIELKKINFKYL